ncbi:hypothetical protein POM88_001053 [Heracleum sosnowskyi]|uniref:Uncharacterized protein n=1 Tax=Heracleum sosnowskyi TaxID=360622 RepID=A0AAD8NBE6_9APIA|nr:hypothetical protein POM88_001053 [Heracleum sosnowskyi]
MDSMMVDNVKAFEYLMGEDPKSWCRVFFDHNSSFEHRSKKFSESFNNMIAKIREKPLCTLILMYGQLVMELFYKRRNACDGWVSGDLVPSAKKLLKLMFKKIGEYKVAGAVAGKVYEVTSIHSSIFVVDLDGKTCSCVQWYCARYYSVDNYKITYAPYMVPLEGSDDWEEHRATIVPLYKLENMAGQERIEERLTMRPYPRKNQGVAASASNLDITRQHVVVVRLALTQRWLNWFF